MIIPDKKKFEPSSEVLGLWLKTRKSKVRVAGIEMPGYFSDSGSASDYGWVAVGIFGELLGLAATIYGGARSGGSFLAVATGVVVLFIILDVAAAIWLHRNHGEQCKERSKKILTDDAAQIVAIDQKIKAGAAIDFMLKGLIVLIAIFKVLGIVLLGMFNQLALYAPFAILYFVVVYVHIKHTGYAWFYYKTTAKMEKEHRDFGNGTYSARNYSKQVSLTSNLLVRKADKWSDMTEKDIITYDPHTIAIRNLSKKEFTINAVGILTDEEIIGLVAGQSIENQIVLFKAARQLQMETGQAVA